MIIRDVEQWNGELKQLKILLKEKKDLEQTKEIISGLHAFCHSSTCVEYSFVSYEDRLWESAQSPTFTRVTEKKLYSPAWHLWHSSRIEDICSSYYFLNEEELLFSSDFHEKMGSPFIHTGNSMEFDEMIQFNENIDIHQLKNYRDQVGRRTQKGFSQLSWELLNKPVDNSLKSSILEKGSIDSRDEGLLDFWGRKKISGLITMPFTRHLLVHLNSAYRSL